MPIQHNRYIRFLSCFSRPDPYVGRYYSRMVSELISLPSVTCQQLQQCFDLARLLQEFVVTQNIMASGNVVITLTLIVVCASACNMCTNYTLEIIHMHNHAQQCTTSTVILITVLKAHKEESSIIATACQLYAYSVIVMLGERILCQVAIHNNHHTANA